jgi:branched-chain amino acid transport system permease protein
MAGAMMTTLDGQLVPTAYQPLRYTFLIWVMVIVGGSGNNFGAVLGGMLIWFFWVQVEPLGQMVMEGASWIVPDVWISDDELVKRAPFMRLLTMGVILLGVLRFSPRGLLPER